jgi:hypothetical protein
MLGRKMRKRQTNEEMEESFSEISVGVRRDESKLDGV